MKNWLLICTLAALVGAMFAYDAEAHHNWTPGLLDKVSQATYIVEVVNFDTQQEKSGTAFYIGNGIYLTAGHVVDGADVVSISGIVMDVVRFENTADNFETPDYAVLYLKPNPSDGRGALELACNWTPSTLSDIVEYGAPSGISLWGTGVIQGWDDTTIFYTTSPPFGPGASGAALVDAVTGRVIGIHVAGVKIGNAHISMAWPISKVPGICSPNP